MGYDQRYKEKHWMHMNYQPLVQNFRYITIFDKWSCIYIERERQLYWSRVTVCELEADWSI